MKIIKKGEKDWQEGADYFKKVLLEADNLSAGNFVMQEVKMKPGTRANKHYHKKQTELFYIINNNGNFIVGDENIKLEAGDLLLVNVGEKHTVANNSKEEFIFLAIKLNFNEKDTYND